MNSKLSYWTITVALAGFLFGFDTVVISGANLPIKELWHTTPWFHGTFIMSMALWGTVIGAIFGGIPCDSIGRKKTLFMDRCFVFCFGIGSGLPGILIHFLFLGLLGV